MTPVGIPVRKIASMSGRVFDGRALYAARLANTAPGYRVGNSWGSNGSAKKFKNSEPSAVGGCVFQMSLAPMPMSSSLTSGLPRRDTWVHGPLRMSPPLNQLPHSLTFWRLAVVHTPITAAGSSGPAGTDRVTSLTGICRASEWTLTSAVEL